LAYTVTRPEYREDLPELILAWLVFCILSSSSARLLEKANSIVAGIKSWKQYHVELKGEAPYLHALWGFLFSLTGILLWLLVHPVSVWKAATFIILWKMLGLVILGLFTKSVKKA
jgi:hypothetical protein